MQKKGQKKVNKSIGKAAMAKKEADELDNLDFKYGAQNDVLLEKIKNAIILKQQTSDTEQIILSIKNEIECLNELIKIMKIDLGVNEKAIKKNRQVVKLDKDIEELYQEIYHKVLDNNKGIKGIALSYEIIKEGVSVFGKRLWYRINIYHLIPPFIENHKRQIINLNEQIKCLQSDNFSSLRELIKEESEIYKESYNMEYEANMNEAEMIRLDKGLEMKNRILERKKLNTEMENLQPDFSRTIHTMDGFRELSDQKLRIMHDLLAVWNKNWKNAEYFVNEVIPKLVENQISFIDQEIEFVANENSIENHIKNCTFVGASILSNLDANNRAIINEKIKKKDDILKELTLENDHILYQLNLIKISLEKQKKYLFDYKKKTWHFVTKYARDYTKVIMAEKSYSEAIESMLIKLKNDIATVVNDYDDLPDAEVKVLLDALSKQEKESEQKFLSTTSKSRRILLISPPARKFASDTKEFAPPIGLTWIAGTLMHEGHVVQIIDCVAEGLHNEEVMLKNGHPEIRYGLPEHEIIRKIKEFNPDFVGISNIFTSQASEALKLCKLIKNIDQKIPVVLGGTHPSMTYKEIMENYDFVDYIIIKEGENAMKQLVNTLSSYDKKLSSVPGLVYRENGKIRVNTVDFILDLNKLPLPAIELLNLKLYNKSSSIYYCYGESKRAYWQSVSLSRGCPHNCKFCLATTMEGYKNRALNPKRVEELLIKLKQNGITDITVEDNNFLKHTHFNDIVTLLKKHGFVYNVINGVDPTDLKNNQWKIKKLKESGCYRIFYPLESVNPESLKVAGKYGGKRKYEEIISKNKEFIKEFTDYGIEVAAAYMVGFPNENIEMIKNTGRFAYDIFRLDPKLISTYAFCVTPFPGAGMFDECQKHGILDKHRVDWKLNPEYYTYDHAQIGKSRDFLDMVEYMRKCIMVAANSAENSEILIGGKSWRSYVAIWNSISMPSKKEAEGILFGRDGHIYDKNKKAVKPVVRKEYKEPYAIPYETFSEEEIKWAKNNNKALLMDLETNYNCDLRCRYCFEAEEETHSANQNKKKGPRPIMKFSDIKYVVDEAAKNGVKTIDIISGGEPLLYYNEGKTILDVIKYIRGKNINVEFFTNGSVFGDDRWVPEENGEKLPRFGMSAAKLAKELQRLKVVIVYKLSALHRMPHMMLTGYGKSCDGGIKFKHLANRIKWTSHEYRDKNNIKKIVSIPVGLKLLLDSGYNKPGQIPGFPDAGLLAIETPITKLNYNFIEELWKFVRDSNIVPYFERLRECGGGTNKDLLISNDEKLNNYKLFDLWNRVLAIDKEEYGFSWTPCPPLISYSCDLNRFSIYVSVFGETYPCESKAVSLGKILGDDKNYLSEILKKPELKKIRALESCIGSKCRNCSHMKNGDCYGGCIGEALALTGDHLSGDPRCLLPEMEKKEEKKSNSKRILIVDDQYKMIGLEFLMEPGLKNVFSVIEWAETFEEAVKKLSKLKPDVVITDLDYPEKTGGKVIEQKGIKLIEFISSNYKIPTIVLSSNEEGVKRAAAMGVEAFDKMDFMEVIAKAIEFAKK